MSRRKRLLDRLRGTDIVAVGAAGTVMDTVVFFRKGVVVPILTVNGIDLYYEQEGSGNPLLLVHGNGEDHTIFDKLVPLLKTRFTVYAIDSRGHGKSSKVETFDYQSMADDLVAFITILGLDKPMLYGFSDGGILGLLLASQHPDLLSRMVISGANVTPDGIRTGWLRLFRFIYRLTKEPKIRMMLEQPNIDAGQLARISIPTMVVAGSHDMIARGHTEYIAAHIPGSRLKILAGEGHGSYVVHSVKLYPIIMEACE